MTKAVSGFIFLLFTIPVLYLLSEGPAGCEEPDLENIIKKVKAQQLKVLAEIKDTVCLAKSIYREMRRNGEMKKEVVARKRIYMKGADKRYDEYLSMSINGRLLNAAEMRKEAEKAEGDQREIKLPLTPEGEGCYNFHLAGSEVQNDMDVWMIDFRAKEKKGEFVDGRGYISKDSFDVIRVELVPAKLSRLVKNLNITVSFVRVQSYWMPVKFEMELKIKVSFLYYKHIIIEETYSEYKLNNQLEDSIFESERER